MVQNKTYFCSFDGCSKTFDRPSRLQWHIRNHTGEKPYKCRMGDCSKAYATSTKLRRHCKTFHKMTLDEKFISFLISDTASQECIVSSGVDPLNSSNDRLKDERQPVDEPNELVDGTEQDCVVEGMTLNSMSYKYKCKEPGCEKSFKRRTSLYNHKVIQHERPSNHRCTVEGCDKVFVFPNLLKRHLKSHEGYSCKQCSQVFSKWSHLRKHVSNEHKKVLHCSHCSKTFQRPCDLRRHELSHSGTKQIYKCMSSGCEKQYDRVATLRKHIKAQHHGVLPYKCDDCVAAFPHLADLKRHTNYHEKKKTGVKKSYPAKGHRKVPLLDRLLGPLPRTASLPMKELPSVVMSSAASPADPPSACSS
ncbi:transcription factor IIIA-like [Watersipora subatra]|uniref:transcription factor IIIA-like n=1 Tax=Watersipora subatra TaxID=2589382 RepID=UPI00355AD6C6